MTYHYYQVIVFSLAVLACSFAIVAAIILTHEDTVSENQV